MGVCRVDDRDGDRRTMWRLEARRDDMLVLDVTVAAARDFSRRRRRARRRTVSVVIQATTMITTTAPMASAPFPPKSPARPSPLRLDEAASISADASVRATAEVQRWSSTHSNAGST